MASLWEQRDGESSKAFEAFRVYRDMGASRGQRAVAEQLNKAESQISTWSSDWNWVERAMAYDRHLDDVRRAENAEAIRAMAERHAAQAQLMQGTAVDDLRKIRAQQGLEENEQNLLLAPEVALRMLDVGMKHERLARGEPETITSLDVGAGDPITRGIVTDQGVRDAAADLVERAALAREGQSRRAGSDDKP